MTPRLNLFAAAPALMKLWIDFGKDILQAGLEESLMELVKIRASQINGCAFCLHMHTAAARMQGETEERLYLLDAWRESLRYKPGASLNLIDAPSPRIPCHHVCSTSMTVAPTGHFQPT
jgi:AhpD family alkylhydroperoxidase